MMTRMERKRREVGAAVTKIQLPVLVAARMKTTCQMSKTRQMAERWMTGSRLMAVRDHGGRGVCHSPCRIEEKMWATLTLAGH